MHCCFGLIIFLWISRNQFSNIIWHRSPPTPKTIRVSDALLSSTVFPNCHPSLLSLLYCLYIFFLPFSFCVLMPLLLLYNIPTVVCLCGSLSSFFCFPPSFLVTSLFVSPLLTFPQSLVLPLSSYVFSIPAPPLPPTPPRCCSPILWMWRKVLR